VETDPPLTDRETQPVLAISWGFMKVLFLGSERSDAKAVATALRGIDDAITVSWAAHLQHGVTWLNDNRDVAALVVDALVDEGTWPSLVRQARSLALRPAVVVIVPDAPLSSVPPDADLCIRRNQFLARDLPIVVARALERVARMPLEHKLAAADKQLAEQQAKYEIGMARAEANWGMVDEQLRTAALQVERARQNESSAAAEVARLTLRESEITSRLAEAAAAHSALEQRLEHERAEAATTLAEREREFEARITQSLDERRSVEELLAQAVAAREEAERRHAEARDHVARLTMRETELDERLAEATASRSDLEGRLAATEAAFEDALARATRERLTASKRAAEREAELDAEIQRERATLAALERTVADVSEALDRTRRDQQAISDRLEGLQRREAELTAQLADVQAAGAALDRELADTTTALRGATAREADLAEQVQQERAARAGFERTLEDTNAALGQVRKQHQTAVGDVERLTAREAELASQLEDLQATCGTLEFRLADAMSAVHDADAREAERAAQLAKAQATQTTLEARIADIEVAFDVVQEDYESAAADVYRLKQREGDLTSELAETRATRIALDRQLTEAVAANDDAQQRHEAALAAAGAARDALVDQLTDASRAAHDAAVRQRELTEQLQQARAAQTTLEAQIKDAEAALDFVQQDYRSASATVARLEQRETDLTSQLAEAQTTRITLDRQLSDVSAASRDAQERHEAALAAAEAARDALAHQLADASGAARDAAVREGELTEQLQQARATQTTLEAQITDAETALDSVQQDYWLAAADVERLAQREGELASQLAEADAARSTLERELTEAKARSAEEQQRLAIQFAEEQREHESQTADAVERNRALTLERDSLQQSLVTLQERVRQLQDSLTSSIEAFELSRSDSKRLFDHAGVAMFRCTRDGALLDANRACTTLVGRRTLDELEGVDFAAAVFDAPQALSWVIERCVMTRTRESIETTWRRQDGSRLFMRLSARSLPSGIIEVVAEDLTRLRVLEERLGQAHRMEAVGRLASEVAITCTTLLSSIQDQGREWLPSTGDGVARRRGERLFEDVGRAAGFLRELAATSDEQSRTPMLVDLNTLVRDLEPVLKNVVSGDVEVYLRDTSAPLTVDVGTERIERLLVNVASYSRGRMPVGARLRIELGTSVVDRHFSAKHPNVRLGLHALITVTESRRAGHEDASSSRAQKPKAHRPGVDFATLQSLVSDCGGHLWMKVHPLGEMLAKIRLPLVSPQDQRVPRALVARSARRATAR
jgi:PAS domain S-box-containing protein